MLKKSLLTKSPTKTKGTQSVGGGRTSEQKKKKKKKKTEQELNKSEVKSTLCTNTSKVGTLSYTKEDNKGEDEKIEDTDMKMVSQSNNVADEGNF